MDTHMSSGQRKRKKRVRIGESDSDGENQPPSAVAKVKQEAIFSKAEAILGVSPQRLALGRTPLGAYNTPGADAGVDEEILPDASEDEADTFEPWVKPTGVGCPGQIKSVTLINFMCHEHLKMDFGPNVNFISGLNGSGKSAVLQAIQQVLGVRARDTGRAAAQGAFIRAGCPEARIIITLWNEGPQAYLPDVLGSTITIERRIGRTASVNVRAASGAKVGQRRADLDAVLDNLQINAANPISVMTQDTTRSFMDGGSSKRDSEKYDIYMEATMLARIVDANNASTMALKGMRAEVESEQEKHEGLCKELKAMEKKLDGLQELDAMVAEEGSLQNALVWSVVASDAAELRKLEQQSGCDGPTARARAAKDLEDAREDLEVNAAAIETQATALQCHIDDMDKFMNESKFLRQKHHNLEQKAMKLAKTAKAKGLERDRALANQEQLMEIARESQADLFKEQEAAMNVFRAEEDSLKARLADAEAEVTAATAAHTEYCASLQTMQREHDRKRDALDIASRQVKHWEGEVGEWERYASNPLLKFGGTDVMSIVRLIERSASKFHRLPIGPVGHLMALSDPQWAQPVENALGRAFNAFLVHDSHDCGVLKALCRANGLAVPPCMVGPLDLPAHNIELGLPPRHILTMYHALACTESAAAAAVINSLIDQAHMEKHALAMSENESRMAVEHDAVISAWQPDGGVILKRQRTSTYVPADRHQKKPRLGLDDAESLKQQKGRLRAAEAEYDALEREVDEMWNALKAKRSERVEIAKRVHQSKSSKRELETAHRNLLQDREMGGIDGDGDDKGGLKAELEQAMREVHKACSRALKAEFDAKCAAEAEEDCGAKLQSIRERIDELEEANLQITEDQSMHEEYLEAARLKVAAREEFCDELEERLGHITEYMDQAAQHLDDHKDKASQICSEEEGKVAIEAYKASLLAKNVPEHQIGPNSMPEVIAKKLERLQKKIKEQEEVAGGMRDVLEGKLRKMRRTVGRSGRHLGELRSAYLVLRDGLDWREAQYNRMERMVEETVNRRFNYYLNKKGHNGSIKVGRTQDDDSGNQKRWLEIKVTIDGSSRNGKVKDLKQLSGGERSFTTVAFSLAVGEFTGSPFRAMDEFDVFMDAINRQTSLESLLTNALEQQDLQFLFLTPQDISAVEGAKGKIREKGLEINNDFVKVLKMRAAR